MYEISFICAQKQYYLLPKGRYKWIKNKRPNLINDSYIFRGYKILDMYEYLGPAPTGLLKKMKNLHPLLQSNPEILKDLLITAVEGGSTYWCRLLEANPDVLLYDIFHPDWAVIVEELDEYNTILSKKKITLEDLNDGFKLLADDPHYTSPPRVADILTENFDMEDADVFFQFVVLGQVLYG